MTYQKRSKDQLAARVARDIFEKLLSDQPPAGSPGFDGALIVQLRNLQQLSISGGWLAYSVVLLAVGIWKGSKGLRFFSIGVFGLSILKIFVYDLEQVIRIRTGESGNEAL